MGWDAFALEWLVRAAAGGFVILAAAPAAIRYCRQPADRIRVAALALVAGLLVPWFAFIPGLPQWSVRVLPGESPIASANTVATEPAAANEPTPTYRPKPEPIMPCAELKAEQSVQLPSAARTEAETAPEPVPAIMEPAGAPVAVWWSASRTALVAYTAATFTFLLWTLVGLWRLARLWRTARPAPPEVVALLREIAGPAANRIRLLVSDEVAAPLAYAGWRPVIVLPESACELDGRQSLRYGLAHEWSHIERGDVTRWYLVSLARVVFFYQPFFWWLRRQLRLSQDYLADARAAGEAPEPTDYAEYLVTLARRQLAVPKFALGITDRRSNLTRRVHMLLLNRTALARRCRLTWTFGRAAVFLGLVACISAVRLSTAEPPSKEVVKPDTKKQADPAAKGETLDYTGKVTDKDTGKAIAGATVVVRRSLLGDTELNDRNPILEESKHTTDANGKYSFTIPPEQSSKRYLYIELDVEHPNYSPRKGF